MLLNYVSYGIIALIIILAIWVSVGSKKRTWYIVYLANNDVKLLCRDLNERWWRTSDRYMRFKDESGKEITFPSNAHWVLMWEAVPKDGLDAARAKVQEIKSKQLESANV